MSGAYAAVASAIGTAWLSIANYWMPTGGATQPIVVQAATVQAATVQAATVQAVDQGNDDADGLDNIDAERLEQPIEIVDAGDEIEPVANEPDPVEQSPDPVEQQPVEDPHILLTELQHQLAIFESRKLLAEQIAAVPNGLSGTEYAAAVASRGGTALKQIEGRITATKDLIATGTDPTVLREAVDLNATEIGNVASAFESLSAALMDSVLTPDEAAAIEPVDEASDACTTLSEGRAELEALLTLADTAESLGNRVPSAEHVVQDGRLKKIEGARSEAIVAALQTLETAGAECRRVAKAMDEFFAGAGRDAIVDKEPELTELRTCVNVLSGVTAIPVDDLPVQAAEIAGKRTRMFELLPGCADAIKAATETQRLFLKLKRTNARATAGAQEAIAKNRPIVDAYLTDEKLYAMAAGRLAEAARLFSQWSTAKIPADAAFKAYVVDRNDIRAAFTEVPAGGAAALQFAGVLVNRVLDLGRALTTLAARGTVEVGKAEMPVAVEEPGDVFVRGGATSFKNAEMQRLCDAIETPDAMYFGKNFLLCFVDAGIQHTAGGGVTKVYLDGAEAGGGSTLRGYFQWQREGKTITVTPLRVTQEHQRGGKAVIVLEGT